MFWNFVSLALLVGKVSCILQNVWATGECVDVSRFGIQSCCVGALDDPSQCDPPSSIEDFPFYNDECADLAGAYCSGSNQVASGHTAPEPWVETGSTCSSTGGPRVHNPYSFSCCECPPGYRPPSPCSTDFCIGCSGANEVLVKGPTNASADWSCTIASTTLATTIMTPTVTADPTTTGCVELSVRATGIEPPVKACIVKGNCKTTQAVIDWMLRPGGEDFRANYYNAGDGDQTIGFGHDCTKNKDCSTLKPPITREQGMELFKKDIGTAETCVGHTKNADLLNINQFSALASFTYNVGCGGFKSSLGKFVKSGDFTAVSAAFPTTSLLAGPKGHRKVLPGLITRRKYEQGVFNTPTSTLSGCPGAKK